MIYIFSYIIPYTAFLGTAVGSIFGPVRINASVCALAVGFILTIISGDVAKLSWKRMRLIVWFLIATAPGLVYYFSHSGALLIPLAQIFGLGAFSLVLCNIFRYARYDPTRLMHSYFVCARISAVIGIVQEVAYLFRVKPLFDLRWVLIGAAGLDYSGPFLRVASLFTEPSYFASFLMPALYFSVLRFSGLEKKISTREGVLYIIALLCTFSTIGYIGLLLCLAFAARLSLRNVLLTIVLLSGIVGLALNTPAVSSRLSSLPNALQSELEGDENLSVLINGLNIIIARNMVTDHGVTGVGLGAYRVYSMSYLEEFLAGNEVLIQRVSSMLDELTLADGGSMYLRLPTELGFSGLIIFGMFLRRNGRASGMGNERLARASLLFILVFSIRSGQIVRFDLLFFCALYSLIRFPLVPTHGMGGAHHIESHVHA